MEELFSGDIFALASKGCIAMLCVVSSISWLTRKTASPGEGGEDKNGIRWKYAVAYLCFKLGDWMQGPYFHKMYFEKVGSQADVAMLFLAGFLSATFFGMVSGSFLSKLGPRKGSLLCPIMFLLGTISVRYDSYNVLLVGRILGGTASAVMHTVPETWFFNQASSAGLPSTMISTFMSWLFFIDGIGAIVAGHLASLAAETTNTSTAPFELSAVPSFIGLLCVIFLWFEDTTKSDSSSEGTKSLLDSVKLLISDKGLLLLMLTQVFFEGTLYLFVMNWGRSIEEITPENDSVPFGQVFATLMAATMIGSSMVDLMKERLGLSPFRLIAVAATLGFLSFSLMCSNTGIRLLGAVLFEVAAGIYFPAAALARNQLLTSSTRMSLSQLLRIPVNITVTILMLNYESLGVMGAFHFAQVAMIIVTISGLLHSAITTTPVRKID